MPHIFLSYSRKDTDIMTRVRDDLRSAGFIVWTDENLTPGLPSWVNAIEKAIETSGGLVVLFSPDARESEWVQRECLYASECRITIFPVLARGTIRVPIYAIAAQRVDLRENEYVSGLQSLIAALRKHLGVSEPKRAALDPTKAEIKRLSILLTKREKVKDLDAVIEAGERILGLDPSRDDIRKRTAEAYHERGITCSHDGESQLAVENQTRAIELDPHNPEYYYLRGLSYGNPIPHGDVDKAIADFTRAIELDSTNPDYYIVRGYMYEINRYWYIARRDYQKATELGNEEAKRLLARLPIKPPR